MCERKTKRIRLKPGEKGQLADLRHGQNARVIALHKENPVLARRLLDMGITRGVAVAIKKIAPLGDPVDIELRGYELCLRRADLKMIDIEVTE